MNGFFWSVSLTRAREHFPDHDNLWAAIDVQGLRAEKKSDKNDSSIDTDLCFTFQTFVVPHKGALGLCKSIVYFLVGLGIR